MIDIEPDVVDPIGNMVDDVPWTATDVEDTVDSSEIEVVTKCFQAGTKEATDCLAGVIKISDFK